MADPEQRLDCDGMIAHPWMTLAISKDVKLESTVLKLTELINERREKSKKTMSSDADVELDHEDEHD